MAREQTEHLWYATTHLGILGRERRLDVRHGGGTRIFSWNIERDREVPGQWRLSGRGDDDFDHVDGGRWRRSEETRSFWRPIPDGSGRACDSGRPFGPVVCNASGSTSCRSTLSQCGQIYADP